MLCISGFEWLNIETCSLLNGLHEQLIIVILLKKFSVMALIL